MEQCGIIKSNLKPVTVSYDEELATPDIEIRYDERIATQTAEEYARVYEEEYNARSGQRWQGQERWQGRENEEMRLVNILSPTGFMRKLRRAGIDAREEPPHFYVWVADDRTGEAIQVKKERSNGRLWLHDEAIRGRVGISAWVIEDGVRVRKLVTWLQYPYGPEWSLMHFDQYNVPTRERYRGWRTALLHLVMSGTLTEDEVNRAFAPVPLSSVSLAYRSIMQQQRNRRGGLEP